MSKSTDTTEDIRRQYGNERRSMLGMLRRVQIRVTGPSLWQAVGVLLLDSATKEAFEFEPLQGIGFFARPPRGTNSEAVVGMVGGRENPIAVAMRDEDTRRKVAKIDQNETMAFNSLAHLYITKAGKIIAALAGQAASAVGLAKTSELNDLRSFVTAQFSGAGHAHAAPGGPTTSTTPVGSPPAVAYAGTDVLKGQ